jgi:hypothetical protein
MRDLPDDEIAELIVGNDEHRALPKSPRFGM